MKEFLHRKAIKTIVLFALFLSLYCEGKKGSDNSALLLLLNSGSSSETTGLTSADTSVVVQETEIQSLESPQNSEKKEGKAELIILNPYFSVWKDNQDKNKCISYFSFTVKNIGKGILNANSTFEANVISHYNVKGTSTSGGGSRGLNQLKPGETQDVVFFAGYPIGDIDDPRHVLKVSTEFHGVQDGAIAESKISLSSSNCALETNESGSPDLAVVLSGVDDVLPGEDISSKLKVKVLNNGNSSAEGSNPHNKGYMVDLILSKDSIVPEGYASYSSNFKEDVLLGGGRISNTPDLAGGTYAFVSEGANLIPKDVPFGNYFLCARIDPGSKVAESNETNNTVCVPIQVQSTDQPDLIVPRASIYPSGMKCRTGKPMMFITAEVKNIGKVASPEKLNVGLLNALDSHGEIWGQGNGVWGNGIGLQSIEPGQTIEVTFPIYYLVVDPIHMEGKHVFDLKVNRGNWIHESDLKNNTYKKSLEITIPEGYCKDHPG
ncbi:CARDB domain-containing protein [Leptospira barantonii]|uniref:CARDB domain protein n=1 Tax=Leptospira barantonii TaxID=2023184 RepID=A0ABX4NQK5_9LEPT|nr:CARDB domain-containing protein [Leptospira barantonii]PJZ57985.1 CARDB domain protein [Leptospira barantonii]